MSNNNIDFGRFVYDHGVETAPDGHPHNRQGWTNIECPFCSGTHGYHLGYNDSAGYLFCWRCGYKTIYNTIDKLTQGDTKLVKILIEKYKGFTPSSENETVSITTKQICKLPVGTGKLEVQHKNYLRGRNFNPAQLARDFDLMGTSNMGDFKFRVLLPIYFNNKLVSYQGRDYTNKQSLRYKTCKKEDEVICHKDILFNYDNVKGKDIILVEGVYDVMRLGDNAVSCFGLSYTHEQVKLLSQFRNKYILFDNEEVAQNTARKLANELSAFDGNVEIITEDKYNDPAEYPVEYAKEIMQELNLQ